MALEEHALYRYGYNNTEKWFDPMGTDSITFFGDGRSLSDGPKSGNWGGKNWSGGRNPLRNGGKDGNLPAQDSADDCYKAHDQCYGAADGTVEACPTDSKDLDRTIKEKKHMHNRLYHMCDHQLVECLKNLSNDPAKWPHPPEPGTEGDSELFRQLAIYFFSGK